MSELVDQVRAGFRQGANESLMTQAVRDLLLEQSPTAFRTVRVVPHQVNGHVESLKLYAIRRNSPLGVLGFRNGDAIRRVNGHDITSPEGALEAYASNRASDIVRIELDRRGQAMGADPNCRGRIRVS